MINREELIALLQRGMEDREEFTRPEPRKRLMKLALERYPDGDQLLGAIERTVRLIVDMDLKHTGVPEHDREMLIQHLTGAMFVTKVRA